LSSAEKQIYKRKKIKSMLFTGRLTAEAAIKAVKGQASNQFHRSH